MYFSHHVYLRLYFFIAVQTAKFAQPMTFNGSSNLSNLGNSIEIQPRLMYTFIENATYNKTGLN